MRVTGTFKGGVVVLDDPSGFPEGTKVELTFLDGADLPYTLGARLVALAESIPDVDLPEDLAAQHEHYRLGLPKR